MSDNKLDEKSMSDADVASPKVAELYRPADANTVSINEKKLMRRIDLHIIPWLALLYFLNFMDRGNIGNAKLYNMTTDCHISDTQYLIALTVYFFPYALFEPVSNVVLRRLRPSIWLSTLMFCWGVVMICHGFIENYGGLVAVRVLLGVFEAGMYPGIVFYISSWYKRAEMGTKIAYFFSSATISGAFSGLLAVAIHNMNGVGGYASWRWIFILEGLFTVVVAFLSFWIIQDYPETAKFLSEEERTFVIRRLQDDVRLSAAGEKYKKKYIWQSLKDWKTWVAMGIYMGFDGPLYAFSLFLPTIINKAFTATKANLLTVPPYVMGCIATIAVGIIGDRIGTRYYVSLLLFATGAAGYIILIASRSAGLSYFAVFLAASAIYPSIRNAWVAGNVEGAYKRSFTLGMAIGWGNINGALSANIYRAKDSPWYTMGHGIVLAYIAIRNYFRYRENARRDRGERDEVIDGIVNKNANIRNGQYPSVDAARLDKGDDWSGFRYVL
ncbi:MFS general substrate transporter [Gymnopus androsaceus JB14]|uniref:MFS general substrate transporter n=1 Tax=Gymnopus androsaceus JB14 TaxID=1447944 RepID=A0A6A4IES0_9AGAR|nr:MFS general substrate transporter [Gymnopus androsaceus JB14]